MPPPAGILDSLVATASDRRTAAGIDHNPVATSERCRQTRIAIASHNNLRLWPNLGAQTGEYFSIFVGAAPGQENSSPRDFPGQLAKHRAQFIRRGQAKIRWRKLPLMQNPQIGSSPLHQDPGSFGPAAFDAEDFFAAVHCRSLACLYHALW